MSVRLSIWIIVRKYNQTLSIKINDPVKDKVKYSLVLYSNLKLHLFSV